MEVIKQHREVIVWVVVALLVGFALGFGSGRQTAPGSGSPIAAESSSTSASTMATSAGAYLLGSSETAPASGVVAEGNSVSVADQPAGMNVTVESLMLSQAGWVAVRDASGVTLGAALFPAGSHTGVSVPLLEPTEAGQTYQVLIYFDDGTKTFNLKTETIVLNMDGTVAGATFAAQ